LDGREFSQRARRVYENVLHVRNRSEVFTGGVIFNERINTGCKPSAV